MVLGGILMALVLVLALPVAFLMSGGAGSVVTGWLLRRYGEESHEGSELVETNY